MNINRRFHHYDHRDHHNHHDMNSHGRNMQESNTPIKDNRFTSKPEIKPNTTESIDALEDIDHRLFHRLKQIQKGALRYAHLQHGSQIARGRDASRGQGRVLKTLILTPEISQRELQNMLDMRSNH